MTDPSERPGPPTSRLDPWKEFMSQDVTRIGNNGQSMVDMMVVLKAPKSRNHHPDCAKFYINIYIYI